MASRWPRPLLGHHVLAVLGAALATTLAPRLARANPMPLPFTYTYQTLGKGEGEVEQYVDFVPTKAIDAQGNPVWYAATQLQTEFEWGITDHLELGLYATLAPQPPGGLTGTASLTESNGFKERLRLRIADEGVLPVDLAFYGEVVENDVEIEVEAKIILEKRFGHLRIAANLWGELERDYAAREVDWVANPTLGATYQLSPSVHLGAEGWMRGQWAANDPQPRGFNLGPHAYVGPTVMFDFGKLWWSTGVYLRADEVDRAVQPGDAYGWIWVRSIVGVGL
jgi:hypothetical protein